MKKLMFTFIAIVGFSFTSSAQCDEQSFLVNTACNSSCVFVQMQFTGVLSVDTALLTSSNGTMRRKPTIAELLNYIAEDAC